MTRERLAQLFAPLSQRRGLLLAVSGGPDSIALLSMIAEWAEHGVGPRIAAATVDHRLRPESAAEAQAVAELCARLGVPHATLVWKSEKPKSSIQERAREARYARLFAEARRIGADAVVTAHHLDDQAETVWLRLMRGSGVAGLAAMRPISERDGLWLARPLLGLGKAELVARCAEKGLAYANDASNLDPKYARPRLRALLAEEGLNPGALARLAERAGRAEDALRVMTEQAEARLGLVAALACPLDALFAEPREIVLRLITQAIAKAGGREMGALRLEQIEALVDGLAQANLSRSAFGANVGGAQVSARAAGRLEVRPETPRRGGAA